jgi:hypothetical protein
MGVWCGSDAEWVIFKASLNGFGKLKLICNEQLNSVAFLDLTITIDAASREIHTKTYQKPKNLSGNSDGEHDPLLETKH